MKIPREDRFDLDNVRSFSPEMDESDVCQISVVCICLVIVPVVAILGLFRKEIPVMIKKKKYTTQISTHTSQRTILINPRIYIYFKKPIYRLELYANEP